jgi:16S rRNA (uracil1498-N3)-methyltransferase
MTDAAWTGRHRFFIPPESLDGDIVRFAREQSHQIARVLRIDASEPVIVLTGDGREYLVELTEISPKASFGQITDQRSAPGKAGLAISLYQAVLPRERFELALSKATEVGIEHFIPLKTQRAVARIQEQDWIGRERRLQSLAREAAEQSQRADIPSIGAPVDFSNALRQACATGPTLVAWERGASDLDRGSFRQMARDTRGNISILVGPEGGFTPDEISEAEAAGATLVWLGPRILRAETAGVVLAAILLYESGDLGFPP